LLLCRSLLLYSGARDRLKYLLVLLHLFDLDIVIHPLLLIDLNFKVLVLALIGLFDLGLLGHPLGQDPLIDDLHVHGVMLEQG